MLHAGRGCVPAFEINSEIFGQRCSELVRDHGYDNELAYMKVLLDQLGMDRPTKTWTANLRISRSTQRELGSARYSRFSRANLRLHVSDDRKVALPINLGMVRREALPTCNNIRHLHIHQEVGEEMNMVRHQKKNRNNHLYWR